jgi:hypothetical protein
MFFWYDGRKGGHMTIPSSPQSLADAEYEEFWGPDSEAGPVAPIHSMTPEEEQRMVALRVEIDARAERFRCVQDRLQRVYFRARSQGEGFEAEDRVIKAVENTITTLEASFSSK